MKSVLIATAACAAALSLTSASMAQSPVTASGVETPLLAQEQALAQADTAEHPTAECSLTYPPGEAYPWPIITCDVYTLTPTPGAQETPAADGSGANWWILQSVEASPIGNWDCLWTITVGVDNTPSSSAGVANTCTAGWANTVVPPIPSPPTTATQPTTTTTTPQTTSVATKLPASVAHFLA